MVFIYLVVQFWSKDPVSINLNFYHFQEVRYLGDACHNARLRDFRRAKSQGIIRRRNLTNFQDLIFKRQWQSENRLANITLDSF